jgi:hypothetical protein
MLRFATLLALAALVPSVHAFDGACATVAQNEAVACEQQRAELVLSALSDRYKRAWAQLPAERRGAFASAERRWLNGGRWDDHAACVAAGSTAGSTEVVAARCLADVTAAHLDALNRTLSVQVAGPQN